MDNYTKDKLNELSKKIDFLLKCEFNRMKENGDYAPEATYEEWYRNEFPKYRTIEGSPYDLNRFGGLNKNWSEK